MKHHKILQTIAFAHIKLLQIKW